MINKITIFTSSSKTVSENGIKKFFYWGAWLAWSEEHMTFDLRVRSSSPMLGVEITYKNLKKNFFY